MKLLPLLLTGIIFFSSCSNATNGNSVTTNPDSTIKWTKLLSGNQCNIESAMNIVIINQEQFDSAWKKAFTMDMPPEKPVIDFTKNSVIALFGGMVNKGGHTLDITAIKQDTEKNISIEVVHTLPGKNCISTMAIEYPYYLALTDIVISDKATISSKNKEVDCE